MIVSQRPFYFHLQQPIQVIETQKIKLNKSNFVSPKMSFVGKYKLVSHENYEEFMTAVGVPDDWKKTVLDSSPIMEVTLINTVDAG